jgi:hypothetical protein
MWSFAELRAFDSSPVFYEAAADDDDATVEGTDRPTAITTMPDKCHAMKTGFFIHGGGGRGDKQQIRGADRLAARTAGSSAFQRLSLSCRQWTGRQPRTELYRQDAKVDFGKKETAQVQNKLIKLRR